MKLSFSLIIPVFNRPDEIRELLESLLHQSYDKSYEIVIVEDGSAITSKNVIEDKKSGEYRLSHHLDLKTGMYKGRQVLDPEE